MESQNENISSDNDLFNDFRIIQKKTKEKNFYFKEQHNIDTERICTEIGS